MRWIFFVLKNLETIGSSGIWFALMKNISSVFSGTWKMKNISCVDTAGLHRY